MYIAIVIIQTEYLVSFMCKIMACFFFYLHITSIPCMPYKGQKKYKNILSCFAMAQLTVPGP